MAKVFLTGANGHVGANTARELLKQGHEVVAFVRKGADLRGLDGLEIELHTGDMLDADSVVKGAAGCDAIIHTAAVYRMWARNDAEILNPAVDGTRHIFATAKAHGIKRLVYTSSTAAVGRSKSPENLRNESNWNESPNSPYYVAKVNSEQLATTLAEEHDIELIRLNPSAVLEAV